MDRIRIAKTCKCGSGYDTLICLYCGEPFCIKCGDISMCLNLDGSYSEWCPFCNSNNIVIAGGKEKPRLQGNLRA